VGGRRPAQRERVGLGLRVVAAEHSTTGVPACEYQLAELREVGAVGVGHAARKIVAGHRLPVVALK
jgi:hypothetical protein